MNNTAQVHQLELTQPFEQEIEEILKQSEEEVVHSILKLLKKTKNISPYEYSQRVFALLCEQKPSPYYIVKGLVLFLNGLNELQKSWAYNLFFQTTKQDSLHYLIAFSSREKSRKLRLFLHGYIQDILFSLNQKTCLKETQYFAYNCRKTDAIRLFFDHITATENFAKITKKQKEKIILHFLSEKQYAIVDCFNELAYPIAINIINKEKDPDSRIKAIEFLGQSAENEQYESTFLKILRSEKDIPTRRSTFIALANLIEIQKRKEVLSYLKSEKDEETLYTLISLIKKFRDTSYVTTLTQMLDEHESPKLVQEIITTLCSFETKRSFQLIKQAFQKGQNSASKVLIYKGYDFKQIEVKNLLRNSDEGQIIDLIQHIFNILTSEKQERYLLANLYNLLEILWFSKSNKYFNYSVKQLYTYSKDPVQFKLMIRHMINIINTEEEPLALVAAVFVSEFSKHYHEKIDGDPERVILHDYVYTQLLSLNLTCNHIIRLVLLNYYNYFQENHGGYSNKIIQRFGFTILEYLFSQFSNSKRKQVAALNYLYQNFNAFLDDPDDNTQILSEALKQFMFKHPKPFSTFLQKYFSPAQLKNLHRKPHIKEQLREHLKHLLTKSMEVLMKKTVSILTETTAKLFEVHTIPELEKFVGHEVQPRFQSAMLPKLKQQAKQSKTRTLVLDDEPLTVFDQIITLAE